MISSWLESAVERVAETVIGWFARWWFALGAGLLCLAVGAVAGQPAWLGGAAVCLLWAAVARGFEARTRRARQLLRSGTTGWAELVGVRETRASADETSTGPLLDLALRAPGAATAGIRQHVGVPRQLLVIGAWLPVRSDARRPGEVVVDWVAMGTQHGVSARPTIGGWRPLDTPPPAGFSPPVGSSARTATLAATTLWAVVVGLVAAAAVLGGSAAGVLAIVALCLTGVAIGTTVQARRRRWADRVLARPERHPAVIVDAKRTGALVNGRQVVKLHLRVQAPGGTWDVRLDPAVPDPALRLLQPGASLPVALDPGGRRRPIIDWARLVAT